MASCAVLLWIQRHPNQMKRKHIAFCVEPAYGHIIPTLGITLELVRRGHLVSYAVPDSFVPIIEKIQARPKVIHPLENRAKLASILTSANDCFNSKIDISEALKLAKEITRERTADSLTQLERLYKEDRPDIIVHNTAQDQAANEFASKWNIPKIRHQTQFIEWTPHLQPDFFMDDELIILTVPEFFQRDRQNLDKRFKFVGFIPEGVMDVFDAWKSPARGKRPILISATTGILPQIDFCRLMVDSFRDQEWDVVLSIAGFHDVVSAIDATTLPSISENIVLNRRCGNFSILANSCLFIGQGGQGSVLEALYHGVVQIVVPPTAYHYSVAHRVGELGLGLCLPVNDLSKESVLRNVIAALDDGKMLQRVKDAATLMRNDRGAELAADLIEEYLLTRV